MVVGHLLTPRAVQNIREDHHRLKREVINLKRNLAHDRNRHLVENLWVAKADAQIPARSGDIAGSGTCSIYKMADDGMLTDRSFNETVYNLDDAVIDADEYFPVLREFQGALWMAAHRYGTGGTPQTVMDLVRFELTATLAPGGTAAAKILICTNDTLSDGAAITVSDFFKAPGRFRGISGYRGVAFKRSDDVNCNNYSIINMDHLAVFIKATLTSTFSGTPPTATATVDDHWQGVAPAGAVTIEDRCDQHDSVPNGATVLAIYDEIDDLYVMLSSATVTIVRFELTTALALSGTATADVKACIFGDAKVNDSITVEDHTSGPGMFKGAIGYEGTAWWNGDAACNYTIITLEHQAIKVQATLTSTFSGTPSTATATLVDFWQGVTPPAAPSGITVEDRLDMYPSVPSGIDVIASYDETVDRYIVDDLPHITIVRFQLTSTLALGSTATADVLACICGHAEVGDSITVEDFTGSPGKFRGDITWQGVAYHNEDATCNFTITMMELKARMVDVTLTSALSGSPPQDVANVNDFFLGKDPGTQVTVVDALGGVYGCLEANDQVLGIYDEVNDRYVIIEADPRITSGTECITLMSGNYTVETADRNVCKISVDRKSGLHKVVDDNDADHIVIRIRAPDAADDFLVFSSRVSAGETEEDEPRWRNSLKLGRDVYVGLDSTTDPGWLYAQGPASGDVGAGIGISSLADDGDSDPWHLWQLPKLKGNIDEGSLLVVKGHTLNTTPNPDELTIDWEYTKPGMTGTLTVDGETYDFEDGILVESSDVTFTHRMSTGATSNRGTEVTDELC